MFIRLSAITPSLTQRCMRRRHGGDSGAGKTVDAFS
jgi:hypothetical protein